MTPGTQFTQEQLDQMRAILAEHDKGTSQNAMHGMKEFDLNNPPKLPYRHQEYPKHLGYDAKGKLVQARNRDEEEKLAVKVKSKTPPEPKVKREKVDTTEDGKVAEE